MKKYRNSVTGRAAAGALFFILSICLVVAAVNLNLLTDSVSGTLQAQAAPTPIPAAPKDLGPKIGYENFTAPGVLVPVKTTEAGQQPNSVEYMGRNAGEPSVGSNWMTGVDNFQSGLQTLFLTFNDSCPADGSSVTWVNRAAPTAVAVDSDPIGFTDRGFMSATGPASRVFACHLTLLSPNTVKISYTDDDGLNWVPTQPGGLASGVDHQTIGGGIYHAPIPGRPPGTIYPYAIYYCSQDIATAFCARSDDGGQTYGASIPLYTLLECGGLHGHTKVSPNDGTVYVPNPNCGGEQAIVVSENNGVTWTVRPVPGVNSPGGGVGSDPAIHADADGRLYFLGAHGGNVAVVATSNDHGATWQNIYDVSSEFGLKQIAFPAAVAGTAGRAAVAFYGSTATGNSNSDDFIGEWHLYVSHTFNGGQTWTTTDVTPNAPMQRSGLLRGGGANITRNLLDFFDITIDREGRVLVGYVDGCEGGPCKQATPTATGNAYTVTATIARQSSGRRQLAAKDPANPLNATEPPGMPSVSHVRIGPVVRLAWSLADTGNSPILEYRILRGTQSGAETLLATVPGTQTGGTFEDSTATDLTKTYYYKVVAVNAVGSSCPNNEIAAPFVGDGCTGIVIHKNDPSHPEANAGTGTPPSLLIDYIAIGEPANSPGNFMFKMKVNDLSTVPPNSRWRITWNSPASPGQQYYVGMRTGPSGPPVFEYGELADAGVPAVFVITEQQRNPALPASNFQPDGTITIFVPRAALGNPQPGDLLGAIGGRTFTGETEESSIQHRSNTFVDHTFVKAQTDHSYPAATYTVTGNLPCPVATNNPPVAVLKATPTSGDAPLNVTFDGTGSHDPDFSDTIVSYIFNFGDGSPVLVSGAPIVNHTYSSAGSYTATLIVTDSRGAASQNTAQQQITVTGGPSPTPTATATASPTATATATASPTATATATASPSATATATASPTATATATASPTASPTATATATGTPSATPTATPTGTPTATPANVQLLNISGRVFAQTGDKVGIGGFIISGTGTKRIMARAIGPSLKVNGNPVQGRIQDTYLELHDDKGSPALVNDNWRSSQEAEIQQSGLAPTDDRESAVVKRLPAGNYTAIIKSNDGSSGIGVVELYDLSASDPGELGNLSVRADVGTGDNALFNGLILQGGTPKRALFRALGPSVKVNGNTVPGALLDPTLTLHDGNGTIMATNDNWQDASNSAEIQSTGLAPPDSKEPAILVTIPAGNYTTVVRGVGNTTGIALAEAYKLSN